MGKQAKYFWVRQSHQYACITRKLTAVFDIQARVSQALARNSGWLLTWTCWHTSWLSDWFFFSPVSGSPVWELASRLHLPRMSSCSRAVIMQVSSSFPSTVLRQVPRRLVHERETDAIQSSFVRSEAIISVPLWFPEPTFSMLLLQSLPQNFVWLALKISWQGSEPWIVVLISNGKRRIVPKSNSSS